MLVQRVALPGSRVESWTVLGEDDVPVAPIERYLAYLTAIERSPNTVKAYAHDLKDFFVFLTLRSVDWRKVRLETERKLLTHSIRMSAYNSESARARLLRPHYARGQDEARSLLREAFTRSGDLLIIGDTLHVRLDPASAPRRSRGLAALCTELTATHMPPGTDLILAYSVKGTPTLHDPTHHVRSSASRAARVG
jgi:hypothetical protein